MEILRAVVNAMRSTGADGGDALATCRRIVADIRAEEREACAKLVEDADVKTYGGFYDNDNGQATLDGAAAAIRARAQS